MYALQLSIAQSWPRKHARRIGAAGPEALHDEGRR